jgi:hypothetical protein
VNKRRQEQQARKAASIAAREARTAAREAYRADKPARLATRFATRTTVVRAARAVAELAASGHEPRLGLRSSGSTGRSIASASTWLTQ